MLRMRQPLLCLVLLLVLLLVLQLYLCLGWLLLLHLLHLPRWIFLICRLNISVGRNRSHYRLQDSPIPRGAIKRFDKRMRTPTVGPDLSWPPPIYRPPMAGLK